MRVFQQPSLLENHNLALSLAPALTPEGIKENPLFFDGIAVHPQVFARGLLVLGDITSTRYFQYIPVALRDPILSAQGDCLRAECFSACNSVYARLDLLQEGFEGEIGFGTTNVDIGAELRNSLANTKLQDKLHVSIGNTGLASQLFPKNDNGIGISAKIHERAVKMPERWTRALGNAAEIHHTMHPVLSLTKIQAQKFISSVPSATGKNQSGWLTVTNAGAKLLPRPSKNSCYISGVHRLSALKRVMTNILSMTFYMPENEEPGQCMVEVSLPGARLTLGLTAQAWQGYSGEGSLLAALAQNELLEDANTIASTLSFNSAIQQEKMERQWNLPKGRAAAALALLAVSGKLGYDAYGNAYFHRELPTDPDKIEKNNPRLKAAKKLVEKVKRIDDTHWIVESDNIEYPVIYNLKEDTSKAKCTCTWYLSHQNKRGPCKHILAVQLKEEE